jgi:diguanylate cyclase (GGDEF)-like protein
MLQASDEGPVFVNVGDDQLREALSTTLREGGVAVCLGTPEAAPLAWVLVEEAPESEAAVRSRLDELARRFRIPPALVLVATGARSVGREDALWAGADELVTWPQERGALAPKVVALMRRRQVDLDCNPLTGLPGARALARRLLETDDTGPELAVVSFDLRHFKAYNDHYGFARGNRVIALLAEVLRSVADPREIVYHIGGDDFVVVVPGPRAEGLARAAVEVLADRIGDHYDEADRDAGYITGVSRETGEAARFGLLGLTVVWVSAKGPDSRDLTDLSAAIARLRASAKC